MSDEKIKEAFEAANIVPSDAEYNERADSYRYKQHPGVDHPVHELYEAFRDGWQASQRQGGEAVEVNDEMAFAFVYAISDGPVGDTEVQEIKEGLRAALANATTSQPAVPEGWEFQDVGEGITIKVPGSGQRFFIARDFGEQNDFWKELLIRLCSDIASRPDSTEPPEDN